MKRVISMLSVIVMLCVGSALPAAAAPKAVDTSGFAEEMLRLVNQERGKAGLPALGSTAALGAAAQKRAEEITARFSHTRPNGKNSFTVLDDYGVHSSHRGENIAAGYNAPADTVAGLMNSSGHKKNILGDFSHLGVGVAVKNGRLHWVQLFIREDASKKPAPAWKSWPAPVQFFARVVLFGWIWMK